MLSSQIHQPSQKQSVLKSKEQSDPAPEHYRSQPPMANGHNQEEPAHQNQENGERVNLVVSDGIWEKYGITLVESGVLNVPSRQSGPQGTNIPSRIIEASEEDSNQTSQKGVQESHQTVKNNESLDSGIQSKTIMSQQPQMSSGPSHFNKIKNNSISNQSQATQSQKLEGRERNNEEIKEEDEDDEERGLVVEMERSRIPMVSLEKKKEVHHGNSQRMEKDDNKQDEEKEPEVNLERSQIPMTSIENKFEIKSPQSIPRLVSEAEKYFTGNNPAEIIKNDKEYHGIRMLKSHSLIRNEISMVINPGLMSVRVPGEVKEYLQKKKDDLLAVQIQPENQEVLEVEKSNEIVESTLKVKNAGAADLERVQERLSIIRSQEKLANNNAQNELVNAASILMESKRIAAPARLEELRQRRTHYMQLFVYIKETIIPCLPEKEKTETQQRIDKGLRDKAMRAEEYLKKDKENNSKELSRFLDEEMPELEPYMLHGKSIEEREKEINEKIQALKSCKESEENLLNQGSADSNTIQENIKTIAKNIEYLNSLKEEGHIWTSVPLIKVGKKLTKGVSLKNENINNNTMMIEFTKIDAPSKKAYFIKWQVDGQESKQNKVFRCNKATLLFNESRTVVFSDAEMKALDTKKIKLDLYSPSALGCLNSVLSSHLGSATLSLEQFRSNNTIEKSVELAQEIRLNYILRIKKELNKNVVESLTVESFTRFASFTASLNISTVFNRYKPTGFKSLSRTSTPIRDNCSLAVPKLDNDTLASLNKSLVPKGVEFDNLLHPDNPEHINSFGVLKEMLRLLEEERMRLIKEMKKEELEKNKEKWDKTLKKSIDIENRIATGDLDTLSYIKTIKAEIERDYRIQKVYQSRGEQERLSFIQEKVRLMEAELKECEAVVEETVC